MIYAVLNGNDPETGVVTFVVESSTPVSRSVWIDITGVTPAPKVGHYRLLGVWTGAPPPLTVPETNEAAIRAKALAALAANVTFLGTVAARRTAIANGATAAATMSTVAVANVAAAQTQIRAIGTILGQVATALTALNDASEATTKQSTAVIRLLLGVFDDVTGT